MLHNKISCLIDGGHTIISCHSLIEPRVPNNEETIPLYLVNTGHKFHTADPVKMHCYLGFVETTALQKLFHDYMQVFKE